MDELIDALQCTRHFALYQDCYERNCYANSGKGLYCNIPKLMADAADALEAADEKIADYTAAIDALDDSNDAYIKENERLKKRIADLETALAACRMRKGEAPKRGEWEERYIEDANPMFRRRFYCSRCGEWTTHGKTRYCPNCGAVMGGKEKTNADS